MGAIDADVHVIETVQTWSYLDEGDRRFTPQLMTQTFGADLFSNEGTAVRDFWVIEGRAHGKDRNVGTNTPRDPSTELNAIHLLRNDKRITPAAVKKILETNPRNFYGLNDGRDCA
jgi:hypothetical protein